LTTPSASTAASPLSLHDALPICVLAGERREDAAVIHERAAFRRDLDQLRDDGVAAREGLRRRGCLLRLLRHRPLVDADQRLPRLDRKSTRLNSSHEWISYAGFCL